jgi:hypothetical protein
MSRIDEIRKDAEQARTIVGKLCSEGRYPKMSIPLREDDEDRILCRALDAIPGLLAEVERLRKALDPIINAYCDYVLADDRSSDESIAQGQMEINIAEAGMELHGNSFLKDWEAMRRKRAGG